MQLSIFRTLFISIVVSVFFLIDYYYLNRFKHDRKNKKPKDSAYTVFSVFIAFVLIIQPVLLPKLTWILSTFTNQVVFLGIVLCFVALILFQWSRDHLRQFYSEGAVLVDDHKLINTGPYQYIRHPIFTSFFILVIGLFMINPSFITLGLAIYTFYDFLKAARKDEELLLSSLENYRKYSEITGRFIPRLISYRQILATIEKAFNKITRIDEIKDIDTRRGQILNVLLLVTGISAITGFFLTIVYDLSDIVSEPFGWLYMTFGVIILVSIILLWVNQAQQKWASWIFVLFLSIVVPLSDIPAEVVNGRSLFFFVFPVLIASFVLPPISSIFIAFLDSLILIYLTVFYDLGEINYIAIIGLFTIGFVSWLISRILDNSIEKTVKINQELDERVAQRTNELKTAIERLQELDTLKSKFVSDVSHELRTPVSNLTIYLDMLQTEREKNKSINSKYISILKEETKRLTQLVSEILDLSRLEAGSIKVEKEPLSINSVIKKIRNLIQYQAEIANVQISFELDKSILLIDGNKDQITQIVTHLVTNAINYSPLGIVKVSTYNSDNKELVAFEVQDNGLGISEKDIDHIFERFYRGDNVSQSTIPGTGLGLAITKELVEIHNGDLKVMSELNQGSTFTVLFPVIR